MENENKEELPLCACGCGGRVRLKDYKFINGHNRRNLKMSEDHKEKIRQSHKKRYILLINDEELPLCACGCGRKVTKKKNLFLVGHSSKDRKRSEESKEKRKQTMIKNRSIKEELPLPFCGCGCGQRVKCKKSKFLQGHSNRSQEVKEKKKQKSLLKNNTENPMQSKQNQEKRKQTILKKYGEEKIELPLCACGCGKRVTKKKNLFITGHNVNGLKRSEESKEKRKQTMIKNYSVENSNQTKQNREKSRLRYIERINHQLQNDEKAQPAIGKNERICLNILQENISYNIEKQVQIIGYFPDGLIKELSLIIEYYEHHHSLSRYKEKDIRRQKDLEDEGYIFFIIKEKEWKENQNSVIEKFKNLIETRKSEMMMKVG